MGFFSFLTTVYFILFIWCIYYFKGISVRFAMQLERTRTQGVIAQKTQTKCALWKVVNSWWSKIYNEKKIFIIILYV